MTKMITAGAEDDGPQQADGEPHADQPREEPRDRKRGTIPSAEDCLLALASLAGAVAMGLLKPAQANAMRANYAAILSYHQQNESRSDRNGMADADVMEIMRKDPKMLSVLEPFLTDEQIDLVMNSAKDGGHG
jgi:hypothetical protein